MNALLAAGFGARNYEAFGLLGRFVSTEVGSRKINLWRSALWPPSRGDFIEFAGTAIRFACARYLFDPRDPGVWMCSYDKE